MIFDTYTFGDSAAQEDIDELKLLKDNIKLANSFESFSDNVRALGISKRLSDGKLQNSTAVMSQFKRDTFFELEFYSYYDNRIVLLKSVYTEEKARGNGFAKQLLEELTNFCVNKEYGLIAICNPFSATSYDRVFFDYLDFHYTGSKEQRNKMAQLLLDCSFKEMSCIAFGGDLYETMVRSILNYHCLVAKWFQFNCPYFDDSPPIEDELIEARMDAIKETVLQNADKFDEFGQNKEKVW